MRAGTTDMFVFKDIFVRRTYDLTRLKQYDRVREYYASLLADSCVPLIVDCGAYIGLSTLFFAEQFPEASITAVEPAESNFDYLTKNTSGRKRITCRRAAISSSMSKVRISNPNGADCGFITDDCNMSDSQGIDAVTIDSLMPRDRTHMPFIVKIDIEGAERSVFAHADWFARTPIVIVELHDWMLPWEGTSAGFRSALAASGADVIISGENLIVFNWQFFANERRTTSLERDVAVAN